MKSGQEGFVGDPTDQCGSVAIQHWQAGPAAADQRAEDFSRTCVRANGDGLLDKSFRGLRRVGVVEGLGHVFRRYASDVAAVGGDDREHRNGALGQCGRGSVESHVVAQGFRCGQGDIGGGEGGGSSGAGVLRSMPRRHSFAV